MKQTAVEWYEIEINSLIEKYEAKEISEREFITMKHNLFYKAKELEKEQQDEFAIGFVEWFTNEKSEYSIMYGNQQKRFATFTKAYTTKQLLEQFKNK